MIAPLRTLWSRVIGLRARRRDEEDLARELASLLEMHVAENVRRGMSPGEARRHARMALGTEVVTENCRDARRLPIVETIWQDVRYAWRTLRRTPAFTATALVTTAVGIGSATAIFSVVNAALLVPPPYPEPHRILALGYPDGGAQDGQTFHYVRERAGAFDTIVAHSGSSGWNLVVGDRAEYVTGMPVSAAFFDVLGARPLAGRGFRASEDEPNGPRAVVLGERLWRRVFRASPDAIGSVVSLGGIPHTVVGVMPAGFTTMPTADLWTPLRVAATNTSTNFTVLGRLRAGATATDAANDLERLKPLVVTELRNFTETRAKGLQWIPYRDWLGLGSRPALVLLFGAVCFLLLIACLNVASLQLVRALTRGPELATRAALGSGRLRLVQQVLTESVLLSTMGGVLGVLLAQWATRGLVSIVPAGMLDGRTVTTDWRVLAFALGLAVGSGLLFGLAPALRTARLDLRSSLWSGGGRTTAGRPVTWLRRSFVVVELALAVVLLVGAGLLIRTFANLRSVDPGFESDALTIAEMSLQGSPAQASEDAMALFERTLARLRGLPGVTAAAAANNIPVERGLNLPLKPPAGSAISQVRAVDWRYVTPDYFAAFRIRLRAGRTLDSRDGASGAPVAIVNEAFARTYFGDEPVVGRSIQLLGSDPPRTIVGVVKDVKGRSASGWTRGLTALGAASAPTMYVPVSQVEAGLLETVHHFFPVKWIVRASRSADLEPAIRDAMRSANPRLPVIRVVTMEQVVASDLELQRFLTTLLGAFAGVSLLLASVGLYGLIAYGVAQRTREIAVRMAMGATPLRLMRGFLAEGVSLGMAGVAIGLAGAALVSQGLAALVFGIEPLDPITFAGTGLLLLAIAAMAALVPAWQTLRRSPVHALRLE